MNSQVASSPIIRKAATPAKIREDFLALKKIQKPEQKEIVASGLLDDLIPDTTPIPAAFTMGVIGYRDRAYAVFCGDTYRFSDALKERINHRMRHWFAHKAAKPEVDSQVSKDLQLFHLDFSVVKGYLHIQDAAIACEQLKLKPATYRELFLGKYAMFTSYELEQFRNSFRDFLAKFPEGSSARNVVIHDSVFGDPRTLVSKVRELVLTGTAFHPDFVRVYSCMDALLHDKIYDTPEVFPIRVLAQLEKNFSFGVKELTEQANV